MVSEASSTSAHEASSGSSARWVSISAEPVMESISWPRSTLKATTCVPQ